MTVKLNFSWSLYLERTQGTDAVHIWQPTSCHPQSSQLCERRAQVTAMKRWKQIALKSADNHLHVIWFSDCVFYEELYLFNITEEFNLAVFQLTHVHLKFPLEQIVLFEPNEWKLCTNRKLYIVITKTKRLVIVVSTFCNLLFCILVLPL